MIVAVFLARVVAALGCGHYFPWSAPALYSGLAVPDRVPPGPVGLALVVLAGAGGVLATLCGGDLPIKTDDITTVVLLNAAHAAGRVNHRSQLQVHRRGGGPAYA